MLSVAWTVEEVVVWLQEAAGISKRDTCPLLVACGVVH